MEQELFAYWLYTLRGIGAKKRHELQQIYGNAEQIYYGDKTKLKESPVFSERDKTLLGKPETVKEIKHKMQRMEQRGIRFCSQESEAFPKKLRYIPDPPYALFYRGMLPDTDRPAIAIVGGRNTGYESREIAAGFGRQLAENGIAVVSGLARGIDISAQKGALDIPGGKTYGVLGTGVDICYPREHIEQYMLMQRRGAVISEYAPGSRGFRSNFARRNRIISGLSDGVLVIAAREGSGSLITAECALEQGKEVFIVPGNILDPSYAGGNQLLKSGAAVVTDIQDILERQIDYNYAIGNA